MNCACGELANVWEGNKVECTGCYLKRVRGNGTVTSSVISIDGKECYLSVADFSCQKSVADTC